MIFSTGVIAMNYGIPISRRAGAAGLLLAGLFAGPAAAPAGAQTYTITTFAGGGPCVRVLLGCAPGDGGPATKAYLGGPQNVATDAAGNVYIVDTTGLRKVDRNGNISSFDLSSLGIAFLPGAIASDRAGNVYLGSQGPGQIAVFDANGNLQRVIRGSNAGFSMTFDAAGNLYFGGGVTGVGKLSSAGIPSTIFQSSVDTVLEPWGVAVDDTGRVYTSDGAGGSVVRIDPSGKYTAVVGPLGVLNRGFSGDNGPGVSAKLYFPKGLALDPAGNLYIADSYNNRIRRLDTKGVITTIAGSGSIFYAGDGGPATEAGLSAPQSVAVGADGRIYVADTQNHVVRVLTPSGGISTGPYTCTNTASPVISSVNSASAYGGYPYFASGSWLEIKGANLADFADPRVTAQTNPGQWTTADFSGVNAPTSLDGISVSINGKPGFVYYISPTQLNVQAPDDSVTTGNATITVTNCKAASAPFTMARQSVAPGLLAPANYSFGGRQYVVATFAADGAYVLSPTAGAAFGLNSRAAKSGDTVVVYGIGFGPVTPSIPAGTVVQQGNALNHPVTVSLGSTPATVSYAGLAGGFVGLYEIYVTVPQGLADGDYLVTVSQDGVRLPQTAYLTVQNSTAPVGIRSVTLSPVSIAAGGVATGTVTLTAPAPLGGAIIALKSSSPLLATVVDGFTIPGGSASATFTITTSYSVSTATTATITATYAGTLSQAVLTIQPPPAPPPFTTLISSVTFQPSGQPSGLLSLVVTPDAGDVTFTASDFGFLFTNGVMSNQSKTFTFNSFGGSKLFAWAGTTLSVSSASLIFTTQQTFSALKAATGSLSGTMAIIGTPYPTGGNVVTLTGTISGLYNAILP